MRRTRALVRTTPTFWPSPIAEGGGRSMRIGLYDEETCGHRPSGRSLPLPRGRGAVLLRRALRGVFGRPRARLRGPRRSLDGLRLGSVEDGGAFGRAVVDGRAR